MVVLPFFVPSHLDSLELRFVRCLGVIVETVEPYQELLLPPSPVNDYPAFRLLVFRGFVPSGEMRAGDDAAEVGWFTLGDMEGLPIIPSVLETARVIAASAG